MQLQAELMNSLEQDGWAVIRRRAEPELWSWYHEIWVLKSRRPPVGFSLFLTFLVDPQAGSPGPYWMIGTSSTFPKNAIEAQVGPKLTVSANAVEDIPQLVAQLGELRQQGSEPTMSDDDEK